MSLSCSVCNKSDKEHSIKKCAKCHTTPYCSRDCQKKDWKVHKKLCGKSGTSAPGASSSALSPPKGVDKGIAKPFTRLTDNTWLHDRSEKDVYRLLLDAYRLRVEDDYKMTGEPDIDSIYGGAPDGLEGFQSFVDDAEEHGNLLPSWWSPEKREECEDFGMDSNQWQNLRCAVEKSDIIEHYGDSQFPMQLRMFAEAVIGEGPGGQDGSQMKQMMAMFESGGNPGEFMSMMNANTGEVHHA